jgi:hypothetical protein
MRFACSNGRNGTIQFQQTSVTACAQWQGNIHINSKASSQTVRVNEPRESQTAVVLSILREQENNKHEWNEPIVHSLTWCTIHLSRTLCAWWNNRNEGTIWPTREIHYRWSLGRCVELVGMTPCAILSPAYRSGSVIAAIVSVLRWFRVELAIELARMLSMHGWSCLERMNVRS